MLPVTAVAAERHHGPVPAAPDGGQRPRRVHHDERGRLARGHARCVRPEVVGVAAAAAGGGRGRQRRGGGGRRLQQDRVALPDAAALPGGFGDERLVGNAEMGRRVVDKS